MAIGGMRFMVLLVLGVPVLASAELGATSRLADWETPEDREITRQAAYQSFHPDHRWRQAGLRAIAEGRLAGARKFFLRSAAYADKAAQAQYALMLWNGWGGEVDRGLALAWMELAAEREYRKFVELRDQFRAKVTAEEAKHAQDVRDSVFDEYGDRIAKPRLETVMRRGLRTRTGSRTGSGGTSRVQTFASLDDARGALGVGGGATSQTPELGHFWDAMYWQPTQYWEWQDTNWEAPGRRGTVTVDPLIPTGATGEVPRSNQ